MPCMPSALIHARQTFLVIMHCCSLHKVSSVHPHVSVIFVKLFCVHETHCQMFMIWNMSNVLVLRLLRFQVAQLLLG